MPKTEDNSIELDTPLTRGTNPIKQVSLRKPNSGELRGLNLSDILQLDVNSLQKLLPRISTPALTEANVQEMDPADLVQLGGLVVGFLLPKEKQQAASLSA